MGVLTLTCTHGCKAHEKSSRSSGTCDIATACNTSACWNALAIEVIVIVSSAIGKALCGARSGGLASWRGGAGGLVREAELRAKPTRLLQRLRKRLHNAHQVKDCTGQQTAFQNLEERPG